jgi:hypothetical protein
MERTIYHFKDRVIELGGDTACYKCSSQLAGKALEDITEIFIRRANRRCQIPKNHVF